MIFWCWLIWSLNLCLGKPSPLESKLEVSRKQEEPDKNFEYLNQILDTFKSQAVAIFNGFGDGEFFGHEFRVTMMHSHIKYVYGIYEELDKAVGYYRKIGENFAKELISIKDEQMRAEEEINKLNFIMRELRYRIPKVYRITHKLILEQMELRGEMIEEFIKKNKLISKSNNKTKDQDDEMLDKYNKTLVAIEVIKPEIEYMNETTKKIIWEKEHIISKLNELLMANILDNVAKLGIFPNNGTQYYYILINYIMKYNNKFA